MNYQISSSTFSAAARLRYDTLSNLTLRDSLYRAVGKDEAIKLFNDFEVWMYSLGLDEWRENVADCDFWSRTFVAYVLLRNARGKSELKPALAEIHFLKRPSDPYSGHSIVCFCDNSGMVHELDPQPGVGLITLTDEQAATCRSFDA